MEPICKDCEHNAGRTCNQNPQGYFEPYGNACARVLQLYDELQTAKSIRKDYADELRQISNIVDPGEHGRHLSHKGALLQRVQDMIARLENKKETQLEKLASLLEDDPDILQICQKKFKIGARALVEAAKRIRGKDEG